MTETPSFEGWAILELMGHRRLAGYVMEQVIAGAGMLRIDIPGQAKEQDVTQFYSPASVYCLTPSSEDVARRLASRINPAPVSAYELLPSPESDDCVF